MYVIVTVRTCVDVCLCKTFTVFEIPTSTFSTVGTIHCLSVCLSVCLIVYLYVLCMCVCVICMWIHLVVCIRLVHTQMYVWDAMIYIYIIYIKMHRNWTKLSGNKH